MENQFLIPANSKKGQLIFNLFFPIDMVIFVTGVLLTFALLMIFSTMDVETWISVMAIIPAGVAVILVFPFPNYHNIRVAIGEVINYYTGIRNYKWRGWCSNYESRSK